MKGDGALLSEFTGIAEGVAENLTEAEAVGEDRS